MSIKFRTVPKLTKMIKSADADFYLKDGFSMVPRAAFEITSGCPHSYRKVIQECISNGWLQSVANVRNYELTYDKLCEK